MKTTKLELSYQREEKQRMKEEADYMLGKGKLTKKDYEKLILQIIEEHRNIVQDILSDNKP